MRTDTTNRNLWALGGVLFAAFFIASDILRGALTSDPLPLPGAPTAEVARYFANSQAAVLAVGSAHILSALSLLAFVSPVATFALRTAGDRGALPALTSVGGILASLFLLASALLGVALALTASGMDLGFVEILRQANFLTGGTLHVASLGVFVGAASISASRAKALPRWIVWTGFVASTLAILSLASLVFFPAALLILLGRMLGFVWCISAGIALALGGRREPAVER
ncbi:MAG: hypothetical protein ACRDSJ_10795 [Rubrobacteraceae bacterium]